MDKKTQLTISVFVIGLVFIYWANKRKVKIKFLSCTDLWKTISNPSAEQIYTDTYNMTENDNDIATTLEEKSVELEISIDKMRCIYTTDYLLGNQIVNINEKDRINKCICDKIVE